MVACVGTTDDHCCHLGRFGVCRYLDEHVNGRRWSCRLRAELGDWRRVHDDSRYARHVRPLLRLIGVDQDCGDWPPPGVTCATCGGCDSGDAQ